MVKFRDEPIIMEKWWYRFLRNNIQKIPFNLSN